MNKLKIFLLIVFLILINLGLKAQPGNENLLIEFLFDNDIDSIAHNTGNYTKNGNVRGNYNYTDGIVGKALEFNDKDVLVHLTDNDELDINQFTIMAWIKPYSRGSDPKRIEIIEKTNSYWMNIRVDDGLLRCGCFFSDGFSNKWYYIDSDRPIHLNQWTHVAFTVSNGEMVSYINGRETSRCNIPDYVSNTEGPFSIGSREEMADNGIGAAYFHGAMDEFRVFNKPLSQKEISAWMIINRSGVAEPSAPLNLRADNTDNGRVKLTWDPVNINEITEFEVFRSIDNSNWLQQGFTDSSMNSFYCSGLDNETTYYFKVRAVGTTGVSPFSEIISIKTLLADMPGLVARYEFENNVNDSYGAYNGLMFGNVAYSMGKYGKALKFEGDGFVEIPQSKTYDFSILMWVNTVQNHINDKTWFGNYDAFGLVDGGIAGYAADFGSAMIDGKFAFATGVSDQTVISNSSINTGNWEHVAFTYSNDDQSMRVYINGVLESSAYGQTQLSKYSAGMLSIGKLRDHNFTTGYFEGMIDELKIYNRALGENEISGQMPWLSSNTSKSKAQIVYPNPANNVLYVENIKNQYHTLTMLNLQGKIIKKSLLYYGALTSTVNVELIPEGIYILQLTGNESNLHQTIMIKR